MSNVNLPHRLRVATGLLLLVPCLAVCAGKQEVSTDKILLAKTIVTVLRERASVPENIELKIEPLRESDVTGFLETNIIVTLKETEHHHHNASASGGEDEANRMQDVIDVLISKDGRYAAIDDRFALGPNINADIARDMRAMFKFSPNSVITSSEPVASPFPGFNEIGVAVADGAKRYFQTFYSTSDNRFLIVGAILPLTPIPAPDVFKHIDLVDQPSQGPSNAKVTLVEFGDVDCPKSAALHELLEKHVLPKYGDRVRVVFKDLPWTPIRTWTWQGSLASQCAYKIEPTKFVAYRSLIFANQDTFTEDNVGGVLLQLAEKAGVPREKIATCMNSDLSRSRLRKNVQEARILGIATTPTMVINGKLLIGEQTVEQIDKAIDDALADEK
jgi:protein-disulfide isomerase